PESGTTVTLYLPRSDTLADDAFESITSSPVTGSGETVFLVEDDASVRLTVTEVLKELGYNVIEAVDGLSAIPVLQSSQRIDLLISDVGLPGMNGREVATIARKQRPELRILFISGYAKNAVVRSGFLDPGMSMITKPFTLEELSTHVQRMEKRQG
ncbi:response regulator, partial [bacterium]